MGSKPVLKHLAYKTYRINLITAVVLAGLSACAFRVLYVQRRRNIYQEFYANYDADKAFERMANTPGLFQVCGN